MPPVESPIVDAIRDEILTLVERYHAETVRAGVAWQTGASELASLVAAVLACDGPGDIQTAGRFERELARTFGTREALLVPSGSAANALAMAALMSPRMGRLQLKPGDEVITVGLGSPSLATAIAAQQLKPVYVDIALPAFNVDPARLQPAISSRTRAVALPHLFGNPCDLDAITMFASFNNLLLVEDCRQAAGASFSGRPVGCFGQLASLSFAPGRQLTAGGGGALLASTPLYRSVAEAAARQGEGGPPAQNSGLTGAIGLAKLAKLTSNLAGRIEAGRRLVAVLAPLADHLILPEPVRAAVPCWSGLPLAVRESAKFGRDGLVEALQAAGVACQALSPDLSARPARHAGPLRNTSFAVQRGLVIELPANLADASRAGEAILSTVRALAGGQRASLSGSR